MNTWQLVARAESITASPYVISIGAERYVAYRTASGLLRAFVDRCPHRGASFKTGWLEDACLRCPYHGWGFDPDGHCVDIPADSDGTRVPIAARLQSVVVVEQGGFVWLSADVEPDLASLPSGLIESLAELQLLASGERPVAAYFGHVTEALTELPYLSSLISTQRLRLDCESVQSTDQSLSASYQVFEKNTPLTITPTRLKAFGLKGFSFEICFPSTILCKLSFDDPINDLCLLTSNIQQSTQSTNVLWFVFAESKRRQLSRKTVESLVDEIFADFALTIETVPSCPSEQEEIRESHLSSDVIVDSYRRALARLSRSSS